ncbi:MAG: S8 family peptidase, partial [Solirubrobacteraceae bacterium]
MSGRILKGGRSAGRRLGWSAAFVAIVIAALGASVPSAPQARRPVSATGAEQTGAGARLPGFQFAPPGSPPSQFMEASEPSAFEPGTVLVGFRPGVSTAQRHVIERAVGATGAKLLGPHIRPMGRGRVRTSEFLEPFELLVPTTQVLEVVQRLRANPGVAYAEPNYMEQLAGVTPNDTYYTKQWADNNTGQSSPIQENEEVLGKEEAGTPGNDDNAANAWQVTTGSRSIVVAELDTGVDYTHPDLAANIWSNPGGLKGYPGYECPKGTHGIDVVPAKETLEDYCNPVDEDTAYHGHGTHVAGIIGAVGNNGIGVTGINWQTTILPVKWIQTALTEGQTSNLILAMQWVVAAKQEGVNIRVVNDSGDFTGTEKSTALENEIKVLGENNILFVSPSGNAAADNDEETSISRWPCAYDEANQLCVTSTNHNDELPSWASYGPKTVDLAAPGDSIYSTQREASPHEYGYMSGTSTSVPQVSGAAALILSAEPKFSATELKADIDNNVDHLPSLEGKLITGGDLDICKAIPKCVPHAEPAPIFGVNRIGPDTDSGLTANDKIVNKAELKVAGSVSRVRVFAVPGSVTSGTETLKAVIYANSGGAPGALLATGSEVDYPCEANPYCESGTVNGTTPTRVDNWINLPFASSVSLPAGTYWIGFITGGTSDRMGYTYEPVEGSRAYNSNTFSSGPSNPFGTPTIDDEQASLYATYTVPGPPVNTALPKITGTPEAGQKLESSNGSWSENPTSYTYQWLRCETTCAAITGATKQTYEPVTEDVGHRLEVQVTAKNSLGFSSPATSAQTAVVQAEGTSTFGTTTEGTSAESDPANVKGVNKYALSANGSVSKLSIYLQPTGTAGSQAFEGVIYAESSGAPGALLGTTSPLTFSSTNSAGWYELNFATPLTLAAGNYWIGFISGTTAGVAAYRYASVTSAIDYNSNTYTSGPSNPFGTPTVASAQLSLYATYIATPVDKTPPTITGTAKQGETLTEVHGEWTNKPTSYTYQWLRCEGSTCTPITLAGASQTYVPVSEDVGHTLEVQETAKNAGGPGNPATSLPTSTVLPAAPV